jgi:hypothetical protein
MSEGLNPVALLFARHTGEGWNPVVLLLLVIPAKAGIQWLAVRLPWAS